MLYNIKGTGIQVTDANRSYVEKRIRALDKFFGRKSGARADIELEFMKDEEKKFRAEATLHDHGFTGDFRSEAIGDTMHEAIDIMVNALNLKLSDVKKKTIDEKRKGGLLFKNIIRGFTDRF
ncbi:MAG: ribosome-associated translation inhibitor RaiA [Patescibacteria group bacterium]